MKIDDKELVDYLKKRLLPDFPFEWDPLKNLGHAWMLSHTLRDCKAHEFPLYLTLSDDGGMYYRATVHHQYDFMAISSAVDKLEPCRAICMAIYQAFKILDEKLPFEEPKFWQMKQKPETPRVGVGVILQKQGNLYLLGQRKGAHGEGQWSLPGGHMELGESFPEVCAREVQEETGIVIQGVKKLGFTNDIFEKDGLHYVTLFFKALWDDSQEPKLTEPDKTVEWKWFEHNDLPDNLFPPLASFLSGL